jgi:hypothetical protein
LFLLKDLYFQGEYRRAALSVIANQNDVGLKQSYLYHRRIESKKLRFFFFFNVSFLFYGTYGFQGKTKAGIIVNVAILHH